MRIAIVSLDQYWLNKDKNYKQCKNYIGSAKKSHSDLVIFPEMTLTGYSLDVDSIVEEEEFSTTLLDFSKLAKENEINIIFGACLSHKETGKPRNMFCLATPDGTSKPLYSKVHPFSFSGENDVIEAGDIPSIFNLLNCNFSASVCYDLRFPELYSATALKTEVGIVIANWPSARIHHWNTLLIARAIENQTYMIGVNRTGRDGNNLEYVKSSYIISPEGDVIEPILSDDLLDVFELDLAEVRKYRNQFPTLKDKRYEDYCRYFKDMCGE